MYALFHCRDNINYAHSPDIRNPLYYIQTPPVSINVSDNVVSVYVATSPDCAQSRSQTQLIDIHELCI